MPIIKENGVFPQWCELQSFEIVRPIRDERVHFARKGVKEKLMVAEGGCDVRLGDHSFRSGKGEQFNSVLLEESFEISNAEEGTVIIRLCGSWGEVTGGSGFFEMLATTEPGNSGDPADYPRNTDFDRHYHDCDEYYILYEGDGVVLTENKLYDIVSGDCVAIGKGHHHDLPIVRDAVKAVYFETTMQGLKRSDHLWNHTHGPAEPEQDRL